MSISKRVLFDNLPEDDVARADIARAVSATLDRFSIRARSRPARPKRDLAGRPRDTFWESARDEAIAELRVHQRNKNGVPHFTTAEDRDRVHQLAVAKWNSRWDEFDNKRNQPIQPRPIPSPPLNRDRPASSAPFVLSSIPPDPRPNEDDLRPYAIGSSGMPKLDRFNAELRWREAHIIQDKNAFLVPFVNWIKPAIDYDAYLKTSLWKGIKGEVLDNAGRKCACCSRRATEVHHRDYRPRVLAGEDLSPLVPVCRTCHDLIEEARDKTWQSGEAKLAELVTVENQRLAGPGSPRP